MPTRCRRCGYALQSYFGGVCCAFCQEVSYDGICWISLVGQRTRTVEED